MCACDLYSELLAFLRARHLLTVTQVTATNSKVWKSASLYYWVLKMCPPWIHRLAPILGSKLEDMHPPRVRRDEWRIEECRSVASLWLRRCLKSNDRNTLNLAERNAEVNLRSTSKVSCIVDAPRLSFEAFRLVVITLTKTLNVVQPCVIESCENVEVVSPKLTTPTFFVGPFSNVKAPKCSTINYYWK